VWLHTQNFKNTENEIAISYIASFFLSYARGKKKKRKKIIPIPAVAAESNE